MRFRKGGERSLSFRGKRSLKKLLQEIKVPPWHRFKIAPYLRRNELGRFECNVGVEYTDVDSRMIGRQVLILKDLKLTFVLRDRFV